MGQPGGRVRRAGFALLLALVPAGAAQADWAAADRAAAAAMQTDLNAVLVALGQPPIDADGRIGPQTRRAVETVARHAGVDLSALPFAAMAAGVAAMGLGAEGAAGATPGAAVAAPDLPTLAPETLGLPPEVAAGRGFAALLDPGGDLPGAAAAALPDRVVAVAVAAEALLIYPAERTGRRSLAAAERRAIRPAGEAADLRRGLERRHGKPALSAVGPEGRQRLVWGAPGAAAACAALVFDAPFAASLLPAAGALPLLPPLARLAEAGCGTLRLAEIAPDPGGVALREVLLAGHAGLPPPPADPMAFDRARCDALPASLPRPPGWVDDAHRRAMEPAPDPARLSVLAQQAEAARGRDSAAAAILRADRAAALARADPWGTAAPVAAARAEAFAVLLRAARSPVEADYLLHLAPLSGAGPAAVAAALERHAALGGSAELRLAAYAGLLAPDPGAPAALPVAERLALAQGFVRLADAQGGPRARHAAMVALTAALADAGEAAAARAAARALRPVAVARLRHVHATALAGRWPHAAPEGRRCWSEPGALRLAGDLLRDETPEAEALELAFWEGVEAVLEGELETDFGGAVAGFHAVLTLRAMGADRQAELLRFKARLYDFLAADPAPEVTLALLGAEVFDAFMLPPLARALLEDARGWAAANPATPPAQRLEVLAQLIRFEWEGGLASRVPELLSEAEALPGEGAPGWRLALALQHAAVADATRDDGAAAAAALAAAGIARQAGLDGLLADRAGATGLRRLLTLAGAHLDGRFCPGCEVALVPFMEGALALAVEGAAIGMDDALAFVLHVAAAGQRPLRQRAEAALAPGPMLEGIRLDRQEAVAAWLDARAISGPARGRMLALTRAFPGQDSDPLAILEALAEADPARQRDRVAALLHVAAVEMTGFGSYLDVLETFVRQSRLLAVAGQAGAARAVDSATGRLATEPVLLDDVHGPQWWQPPDAGARLRLARSLAPLHARLAEDAMQTGDAPGARAHLAAARALMEGRLAQDWEVGSDRAALLTRDLADSFGAVARQWTRLAMADPAELAAAFEALQLALMGETALATQAAVRNRLLADPALRAAVEARDTARQRLAELDAIEAAAPSRLPGVVAARRAGAAADLAAAQARIDALLPVSEDFAALRAVPLAEVAAVLAPDEALVVLHAGPGALYGLALRPGREGALAFASAVGAEALTERVTRLRRDASAFGTVDMENAAALYELLLGPAEPVLAGAGRVVVVGDGPVPGVPWPMLATGPAVAPDGAGTPDGPVPGRGAVAIGAEDVAPRIIATGWSAQPWLIRRFPVSLSPGVASLVAQRDAVPASAAPKPFLGIGDPLLAGRRGASEIELAALYARGAPDAALLASLAPLPETARELTALAQRFGAGAEALLLGGAATETALMQRDLSAYRVIAFATHGILAGEIAGAAEPGLVLTPEPGGAPGRDGYLSLSEILGLRLDADLVILSACNTGAGDGRPRAEWMSGLARGFISAGARQLLVTLWAIPSDPTVRLTTATAAAQETTGDWPRALQAAMLAMIDAPGTPLEAHPASWAGFALLGAGR